MEGHCHPLTEPARWQQFLSPLRATAWVVYAKPPVGGPGPVLKYLARYTHRVAITNRRLLALEDGRVTFRWKDYAHGNRQRLMTLEAVEFIRRFLLHIFPPAANVSAIMGGSRTGSARRSSGGVACYFSSR